MLGRTFEFIDMYTDDYITFDLQNWFVGLYEGHNPPGLDSSYYKSPHFGIQTKLNIKYPATTTWVNDFLWTPSMFSNLDSYIEKTRPINTVPHYYALLEPITDENNEVTETAGEIYTKIVGDWTTTKVRFDESEVLGSEEGENFDETDVFFDQSQDAFYEAITGWVLGTGSKGSTLEDSLWDDDLETPVLSGTVDKLTVSSNKIVWEIIVSATTLSGISELGLYTPGTPDVLRVACAFPDINLGGNVDLRIIVTVNRI